MKPGALGREGCFVLFQVVKGKVMAGSNIRKKQSRARITVRVHETLEQRLTLALDKIPVLEKDP